MIYIIKSESINYILLTVITAIILISFFFIFIKKIFKFFLVILVLVIVYLGYQYIINSVSPVAFFNNVKTDAVYLMKTTQKYNEIKKSTNQIKNLIDDGNLTDETIVKITEENNKLLTAKNEIQNMPHSKILDNYHSLYMLNLDKIIITYDAMVLLTQSQQNSSEIIDNLKEKVNNVFDYIKDIK